MIYIILALLIMYSLENNYKFIQLSDEEVAIMLAEVAIIIFGLLLLKVINKWRHK